MLNGLVSRYIRSAISNAMKAIGETDADVLNFFKDFKSEVFLLYLDDSRVPMEQRISLYKVLDENTNPMIRSLITKDAMDKVIEISLWIKLTKNNISVYQRDKKGDLWTLLK